MGVGVFPLSLMFRILICPIQSALIRGLQHDAGVYHQDVCLGRHVRVINHHEYPCPLSSLVRIRRERDEQSHRIV